MFRDIVALLASLFVFGMVYWILNLIIGIFQSIFTVSDAVVIAVYFLWSMVPIIYYVAKAKEFFESRGVGKVQ